MQDSASNDMGVNEVDASQSADAEDTKEAREFGGAKEQQSASAPINSSFRAANSARTTQYPRMMDPSASLGRQEEEDVPLPSLLRPEGLTRSDYEERSRKFDSAFGPLAELSAEDVVVGCATHGSELVSQSRDHFRNFAHHIGSIDTSRGTQSALNSLEAGQLVQLPVAATKACIGTGLYGVAATARFGPKLFRLCKAKAVEWQLAEKTTIASKLVADKAKHGYRVTARNVQSAWSWLKTKVADFYSVSNDQNREEDRVDV